MEKKNPSVGLSSLESANQRMQHPERYLQQAASIILETLLPEELINELHEAGYPATEDEVCTMESYARNILMYVFTGMMPHRDVTYMLAIDRIVFAYEKYLMQHPDAIYIIAGNLADMAVNQCYKIRYDMQLMKEGGQHD